MSKNICLITAVLVAAGLTSCQRDAAPDEATQLPEAAEANQSYAAPSIPELDQPTHMVTESFEIPAGAITSVRLEPTASRAAKISFSPLVLVVDGVETRIDLCDDRRLQLVRSRKLAKTPAGDCLIEFGGDAGTGWMAPTALRNLPESSAAKQLSVSAVGDITSSFKIFYDTGKGYRSADMVEAVPVPSNP